MPDADRAGTTAVNAFPVGDRYLFKHYFEENEVFAEIREYYNRYEYRFEVPATRFETVRSFVSRYDYDLIEVDDVASYAVVKRKFTDHPRVLFAEGVLHRGVGNFNCFVMRDRAAVTRAVETGARPLAETTLEMEF